jgi:hypothetical protein
MMKNTKSSVCLLTISDSGADETDTFTGNFLYNNYKQALAIIKNYTPELDFFKLRLQVTDTDIEEWIHAERKFLEELKEEPEERVLAAAYVEALIQRRQAE